MVHMNLTNPNPRSPAQLSLKFQSICQAPKVEIKKWKITKPLINIHIPSNVSIIQKLTLIFSKLLALNRREWDP